MSGTTLAPGSILEGRYRIDEPAGEGGHGVVYRGHHLTLDIPLAIKVVRFEGVPSDFGERTARFLEEARTLSKLRHPNIVRVLDMGVFTGDEGLVQPWLVMEWCGGRTLRDDLDAREGRPRTVAETWALVRPLVDAVAVAHAKGIVHRDIKPSNVMLVDEEDGSVAARLVDFGIAKRFDREEVKSMSGATGSSGPAQFTPGYAAPEQILGVKTGPWTDVHALALLISELLVGRTPYGADADIAAIVDQDRPTPAHFGVAAGAWEPVLQRALSIRTTERFADGAEFLDALRSALDEAPPDTLPAAQRASVTSSDAPASAAAPRSRTQPNTLDLAASEREPTGTIARGKTSTRGLWIGAAATIAMVALVVVRMSSNNTAPSAAEPPRIAPTASDAVSVSSTLPPLASSTEASTTGVGASASASAGASPSASAGPSSLRVRPLGVPRVSSAAPSAPAAVVSAAPSVRTLH